MCHAKGQKWAKRCFSEVTHWESLSHTRTNYSDDITCRRVCSNKKQREIVPCHTNNFQRLKPNFFKISVGLNLFTLFLRQWTPFTSFSYSPFFLRPIHKMACDMMDANFKTLQFTIQGETILHYLSIFNSMLQGKTGNNMMKGRVIHFRRSNNGTAQP